MTDRAWQASWIWGGETESPRNEWRCFRGTFEAEEAQTAGAKLRIVADSRYVLYVNGAFAGRGPVRSWPAEPFYDTYEIGHLLRPGQANTVAVLVMHFGISNFYYLRGRGGLLAEVQSGTGEYLAATDGGWRTARHGAQDPSAPRMSCQQGFAEIYDAGLWDERWIESDYDDASWTEAAVIGEAGMAPWTTLQPRDIPFLTEEKLYPSRIRSLAMVKAPAFMAAVYTRGQFYPESENHANPVGYVGYLATIVTMERTGELTLGFPGGARKGVITIDGQALTDYTGEQPERYYRTRLAAGDHLVLIDITATGEHGWGFHVGADADCAFTLRSPLEGSAVPFAAVGPYDATAYIDYKENRELRLDHPDYLRAAGVASVDELLALGDWVRPVDPAYYTDRDVFGSSVWQTVSERLGVPLQLQNAILPVPEAAVIPFREGSDTELVIDLGKERSGFIGLEIDAPAGTVVDAYGIEYIRDDYRQHTYGLDNTFRYICREGRQRYESPVRRGFRYLILTIRRAASSDAPVRLHEVSFRQSTYPAAEIGSFRSSDALLNEIWEISRHTTRLCMEDTFVDCPSYEQVFWVGDARNEALVNYYVFGVTDIVKRCLKLVPGSSEITPLYLDQVPSGWNSVIPNWTFFWVIACEEYIAHTGDRAFAADIWPAVRLTLEAYRERLNADGLLSIKGWNLLDWAPIDQPNEGIVTHQNLFFVKALRQAARIAEAAGAADAERAENGYAEAADRLAAAINERLWDEPQQAYLDCIHADGRRSEVFSMQTQVAAYLCEVAEGERREVIDRYLVQPPAAFVQIGSPFMSFFYYEALRLSGRYRFMLDDIRKHYGMMTANDATTCWEMYPNFAENRANPNQLTRSHCHAWSAAPGYFLGETILGVKRKDEGWRRIEVSPQPCDLTWANGVVPLPQGGHVAVSWRLDELSLTLRIEAPDDVEVDVVLPEGLTGYVEQVTYSRAAE